MSDSLTSSIEPESKQPALSERELLDLYESPDLFKSIVGGDAFNAIEEIDPDYVNKFIVSNYLSESHNIDNAQILENYESYAKSIGYSGIPANDANDIASDIRKTQRLSLQEVEPVTFTEGISGAARRGVQNLSQSYSLMGISDPTYQSLIDGKLSEINQLDKVLKSELNVKVKERARRQQESARQFIAGTLLLKSNEIKNFIDAQSKIESAKLSEGYKSFVDSGNIPTSPKAFGEFLVGFMTEQSVQQAPMALKTMGSGFAGSPAVLATVFSESFHQERSFEMMQHLRENGVNFDDQESLNAALSNDELMSEAMLRGVSKAFPIAITSALSAYLPIKGKTALGKLGREVVTQAGLDSIGEVLGQSFATGEVDMQEVMLEVLGGTTQSVAEFSTKIAANVAKSPINSILKNEDGSIKSRKEVVALSEYLPDDFAEEISEIDPVTGNLVVEATRGNSEAYDSLVSIIRSVEETEVEVSPELKKLSDAVNEFESASVEIETSLDVVDETVGVELEGEQPLSKEMPIRPGDPRDKGVKPGIEKTRSTKEERLKQSKNNLSLLLNERIKSIKAKHSERVKKLREQVADLKREKTAAVREETAMVRDVASQVSELWKSIPVSIRGKTNPIGSIVNASTLEGRLSALDKFAERVNKAIEKDFRQTREKTLKYILKKATKGDAKAVSKRLGLNAEIVEKISQITKASNEDNQAAMYEELSKLPEGSKEGQLTSTLYSAFSDLKNKNSKQLNEAIVLAEEIIKYGKDWSKQFEEKKAKEDRKLRGDLLEEVGVIDPTKEEKALPEAETKLSIYKPFIPNEEGGNLKPSTWESLAQNGYKPSDSEGTQIPTTKGTYEKISKVINKNEKVLDFSSGLGHGTKAIADDGHSVDSYEPFYQSDKGVVEPTFKDSSSIPSDSYDVVINNAVLNVVPEATRIEILQEIYRVLKPGGRAYINLMGWGNIKSRLDNPKTKLVGPREVITSKGTFQKGYTQNEFKGFVDSVLPEAQLSKNKFGDVKIVINKPIKPSKKVARKKAERKRDYFFREKAEKLVADFKEGPTKSPEELTDLQKELVKKVSEKGHKLNFSKNDGKLKGEKVSLGGIAATTVVNDPDTGFGRRETVLTIADGQDDLRQVHIVGHELIHAQLKKMPQELRAQALAFVDFFVKDKKFIKSVRNNWNFGESGYQSNLKAFEEILAEQGGRVLTRRQQELGGAFNKVKDFLFEAVSIILDLAEFSYKGKNFTKLDALATAIIDEDSVTIKTLLEKQQKEASVQLYSKARSEKFPIKLKPLRDIESKEESTQFFIFKEKGKRKPDVLMSKEELANKQDLAGVFKEWLNGADWYLSAHDGIEQLIENLIRVPGKQYAGKLHDQITKPAFKAAESFLTKQRTTRESAFDAFNKVLKDKGLGQKQIKDLFMSLRKAPNFKKGDTTGIYFESEPGYGVKEQPISPDQAIQLWMWRQDKTLQGSFDTMKWTDEVDAQLESYIGKEGIALAEYMLSVYKKLGVEMNDVLFKVEGWKLPIVENYSPVSKKTKNALLDIEETMKDGIVNETAKNNSMKLRVDKKAPLDATHGALAVFDRHISEMNHWITHGEIASRINNLFKNERVKRAITQIYGPQRVRLIMHMIENFTRGGIDRSRVDPFVSKLIRNIAVGKLALNFPSAIKQLGSIPAYANAMPAAEWSAGFLSFLKNPSSSIKILLETDYIKNRITTTGDRDLRAIAESNSFQQAAAGAKNWRDRFMILTRLGDVGAIMAGGWPVYKKAYDDAISAGKSISEAKEIAEFEFGFVSDRSQQSSKIQNLSYFQSAGSFAKLFTMFMTSPIQYMRITTSAARAAFKGRITKREAIKTFAIYHVILPSIFTAMGSMGLGIFSDDEEKYEAWKRRQWHALALGNLNSLFLIGEAVDAVLGSFIKEEDFYDLSNPVISEIESIVRSAANIDEEGNLTDLVGSMALLMGGIPYDTISREFEAKYELLQGDDVWQNLWGISDWAAFETQKKKKKKKSTSSYYFN